MAHRLPKFTTNAALIVLGVAVSAWTGTKLSKSEELAVPLNPFGVNRSPYGEVLAMAMQGPINTDFHIGMYGATDEEIALDEPDPQPGSLLIVKPDPEEEKKAAQALPPGIIGKMQVLIDEMRITHGRRTNALPASQALKFYLRRKAEDKLRLAYNLDPAHYANYNALHFFLTEGIGTRPELTPGAANLARETIDYCLKEQDDPRPALTAAAACTNILHLMFADDKDGKHSYSTEQMMAVIVQLDQCLDTYHRIAQEWDETGAWQRLSSQRIEECHTRISFISKIRDAALKTVQRIHASR